MTETQKTVHKTTTDTTAKKSATTHLRVIHLIDSTTTGSMDSVMTNSTD